METVETEQVENDILKCRDVDELKKYILPEMKAQEKMWSEKITEIANSSGMSDSDFAGVCGFTRQSLYKWKRGRVPDRKSMMRIGLTAGYSLPEMNTFLMRYGRYPHLNLKNIDDCICEYVINMHLERDAAKKFIDICVEIDGRTSEKLSLEGSETSTASLENRLSDIEDDEDLMRFIDENSIDMYGAYTHLADVIDERIKDSYAGSVNSLADSQNWTSFMRQRVSQIRQKKCIPDRKDVILLGLYLGIEAGEIDELLETARMNELYPKNPLEGTILFALKDASEKGLYDMSRQDFDTDNIYRYVRKVLLEVGIPEAKPYLHELSDSRKERGTR